MRITSFVMGMGVGAAAAMLFAPRPGNETREMIAGKAREGRRYARDRAKDLRDMAGEAAGRGREVLNRQKNAVSAAAQAAKETYVQESQTTHNQEPHTEPS